MTTTFDHRPLLMIHNADHAARAGDGPADDQSVHHHIVHGQLMRLMQLPGERLDEMWVTWNRRSPSEPVFDFAIARCVEILEQILDYRDASDRDGEPALESVS